MASDKEKLEQYAAQQEIRQTAGQQPRDQNDSTDELLDLDKVKSSLRAAFLGYSYKTIKTEDGLQRVKEWRVEDPGSYDAICNENALEDFFVPIEGIANINTAGSNLTDKQIQNIGRDVQYAIIGQIRENHEEYGIDSMADADQIVATIREVLMAALTKGRGGWMTEQRQKSTVRRVLETAGVADDDSKGWF